MESKSSFSKWRIYSLEGNKRRKITDKKVSVVKSKNQNSKWAIKLGTN